jgi:hypothetical protein
MDVWEVLIRVASLLVDLLKASFIENFVSMTGIVKVNPSTHLVRYSKTFLLCVKDIKDLVISDGNDLTERKQLLMDNGDCIIVLPGGLGDGKDMQISAYRADKALI